ncbi:EDD domain protein, DegV family [Ruminococcaceae bacterium FB2012]|nr:EDD domain protein, DegV family [Ruminococcaceae bacterium FB2012]
MAKIKLITDAASDIAPKYEKELDIRVIPFKVAMGDKSYTSGVDFDNAKFYKMLDEYDGIPATSQITVFDYEEIFAEYYGKGYTDIINVTINSEGSATYNNSCMAANNFFEEHPEAKGKFNIYNIDSEGYTGAYGWPVLQAAEKIKKGIPAAEIADYIKEWVSGCVIYFAMYTLKYARKSGRIPSAAAFVGEVMGLRPVMRIHDHQIKTHTKVRGDKAVIPKIIDLTAAEIIPQTPYCIVYGKDEKVRDELAEELTKKLGYPPAEYFQIGAAIAINAGPLVVGAIFKSSKP